MAKRKVDFSNRILARVPRKYDHRDYLLRDYITPYMRQRATDISANVWAVDHILDQGSTPHCVGYAWAGYGISDPVQDQWDDSKGEDIYYAAKVIDGEPNQEDGSSTLSGVKAFMEFAYLVGDAYAWAGSIEDIKIWVLTQSPVIVGSNWYYNMFSPDSKGQVHIGGGVAGGHEYMVSGYDRNTDLFLCTNSWGTSFGINGQFYISATDLAQLLSEQGDACTAVELNPAPAPTPTPVPTPTPTPPSGCLPKQLYWLYKKFGG